MSDFDQIGAAPFAAKQSAGDNDGSFGFPGENLFCSVQRFTEERIGMILLFRLNGEDIPAQCQFMEGLSFGCQADDLHRRAETADLSGGAPGFGRCDNGNGIGIHAQLTGGVSESVGAVSEGKRRTVFFRKRVCSFSQL